MKKSLPLFVVSILLAMGGLAQPTLTAVGINPAVGNVFTITSTTNAVSPGTSGANQTWNLTAITGTPVTNTVVAASSTTYSASFPGANVAIGTGNTAYYKTASTAWQIYGVQQGTVTVSYSNPEDFLHYPFTYNNNFLDTWGSTFVNGGATYYRSGHDTVTADGYGTLITPAGSFSNVLRVHLIQNYQDSANFGGPFIIPYRNDEYLWFLNGNHNPIAVTYTFTTSGNSFTNANYMSNVAVGIEESMNETNALRLFPSPAANQLSIALNLSEDQMVNIKFLNSLGTDINAVINQHSVRGNHEYAVDVSNLPEGIYFALISLDGNLSSTRRFVISR